MARRMLKLTWIGTDGDVYHEATLSPRIAQDVLVRDSIWVQLYLDHYPMPMHQLTWAAVNRARRASVAKFPDGREVIIDVAQKD